jgi:uncharacterized Fe-S center protein
MKSEVYFVDMRAKIHQNLFLKLETMLDKSGFGDFIRQKDLVAVKIHFGEKGNLSYLHPRLVKVVLDKIKALGGNPFLTDAGTLYVGSRSDAVSHIHTAVENGFSYASLGVPIIVADGLTCTSTHSIQIDGKHLKSVEVGREALNADRIVCLTHFKVHELTGLGGALKNLGMGLAGRAGKLAMHSTVNPYVSNKCIACGTCLEYCPAEALQLDEGDNSIARINAEACIGCGQCLVSCPHGYINVHWNENTKNVQEKICEFCHGILNVAKKPAFFINMINNVTPECDCYNHSDAFIVPDIGILAASDPIAIDQASADLVNQARGLEGSRLQKAIEPGTDKFRDLYPKIDWTIQLQYGEKIGLGSRKYRLIKLLKQTN